MSCRRNADQREREHAACKESFDPLFHVPHTVTVHEFAPNAKPITDMHRVSTSPRRDQNRRLPLPLDLAGVLAELRHFHLVFAPWR
jgi:hypothetical protein